jgi:hypothetical protein
MTPPLSAVPDTPVPERGNMTQSNAPLARGGSPSPLSQRRVLAAERHRKALSLRGFGLTYDAIAKELGYSSSQTAKQAVAAALKSLGDQTRAEYIAEVNARLDQGLVALSERLQRGEPRAWEVVVQIEARRAAMLGLDAPKKVEITDSQLEEERERLRAEVTVLRSIEAPSDVVDAEIVEDHQPHEST